MRLRKDQIQVLAKAILDHLKAKELAHFKTEEARVLTKIQEVITANLEAEDRFDQEVEQIMDQYRSQIQAGHLNERDLFLKIKKELAKKKKFIL